MRIQYVVREYPVQLSIGCLLSLLPSHWETLQDRDISVTNVTELCPCWPGRSEATGDVGSWPPQGWWWQLLRTEHGARGWGQLFPVIAFLQLQIQSFRIYPNFRIYYDSYTEAPPCHSVYIPLAYFHRNNKSIVSAGL